MIPRRKMVVLVTLTTGIIRFQAQNYFGIVFHQSNMQNRRSYSLGAIGEYPMRKSIHWYLDFQHDIGLTSQGLLFVHTTLPFALYASAFSHYGGHYHHNDPYTSVFALLLPSGVTYYYTQTRQIRQGIYANPLNYTYWQTEKGTEICTVNPEAGFKIIKHLQHRNWLLVSAGLGYSFSIGSENILPIPYTNSLFTTFKIAIVNGDIPTFHKGRSRRLKPYIWENRGGRK